MRGATLRSLTTGGVVSIWMRFGMSIVRYPSWIRARYEPSGAEPPSADCPSHVATTRPFFVATGPISVCTGRWSASTIETVSRPALRRRNAITAVLLSHSHVGEKTFVTETFVTGLGLSFSRSVSTKATAVIASRTRTTSVGNVRDTTTASVVRRQLAVSGGRHVAREPLPSHVDGEHNSRDGKRRDDDDRGARYADDLQPAQDEDDSKREAQRSLRHLDRHLAAE